MTNTVAIKAANTPTRPATYPFGVQWYWPFEPTTRTKIENCMNFKKNCMGVHNAV